MQLFITGASGFVGSALCQTLVEHGHAVTAVSRDHHFKKTLLFSEHPSPASLELKADFADVASIQAHLSKTEAIVHCAARVHQTQDTADDPLTLYRQVNCMATLTLAQAAAQAGVKRFVFLSSVKVNGEYSALDSPFRADDAVSTLDPYGLSKWEAEQGLRDIATQTGMEVVIIRPPLIYGPGVKANFFTMMRWLHRGIPLPFGAIHNQRSLVALPNLVDFIEVCLSHPLAANQTFMISDQHDLSTTELLSSLGAALRRPARLVSVPQSWLELSLKAAGKASLAQRLCADLRVDAAPASVLLGWKPPVTVNQGLNATAEHFLAQLAFQHATV